MFGNTSRHYTSNQQEGSWRKIISLRRRRSFNSVGHIAIGDQIVPWRMKRGQGMLLTISFIGDIEHCDTHDEHYVCATQTESIELTGERSCASLSGGNAEKEHVLICRGCHISIYGCGCRPSSMGLDYFNNICQEHNAWMNSCRTAQTSIFILHIMTV